MPTISEDELSDSRIHSSVSQSHRYNYTSLSKAEQRKNNKPIMEKRRRARINQCLNELKALILDATNKDPSRHTKLEKADILEMTVKHLQSVQKQQLSIAMASDPTVLHKFKTGFSECANEVSQYIGHLDVETGVKQRLVNHLTNYVTGLHPSSFSPISSIARPPDSRLGNSEDFNNNNDSSHRTSSSALHFIPSRLPTGELALLLPNSSPLSNLFPASLSDRSHPSAFTAVSKDSKTPTPIDSTEVPQPPGYVSPHTEVSSTSNDCISLKNLFRKQPHSDFSLSRDMNPDLLRPVTVYTDPCADIAIRSVGQTDLAEENCSVDRSPLDFSLKKEFPDPPPVQKRKRPLESISGNVEPPRKKSATVSSKVDDALGAEDLSNRTRNERKDEKSGDMWRPW